VIIVRYGEIAIKRGKRKEFERKLAKNIEKALERKGITGKIKVIRGRILVDAPNEAAEIIAKVPGVVSVSPAEVMDYNEIPNYLKEALKGKSPRSFKVETQRLDKTFLRTSIEVNRGWRSSRWNSGKGSCSFKRGNRFSCCSFSYA